MRRVIEYRVEGRVIALKYCAGRAHVPFMPLYTTEPHIHLTDFTTSHRIHSHWTNFATRHRHRSHIAVSYVTKAASLHDPAVLLFSSSPVPTHSEGYPLQSAASRL